MQKIGLIAAVAALGVSWVAYPAQGFPNDKSEKESKAQICQRLSNDYENASKKLAMIFVEGTIHDSAPRATMREAKSNKIIAQARFTMDLLKDHECDVPSYAPSSNRYLLPAMDCLNARLEQRSAAAWGEEYDKSSPSECEQTTWEPS